MDHARSATQGVSAKSLTKTVTVEVTIRGWGVVARAKTGRGPPKPYGVGKLRPTPSAKPAPGHAGAERGGRVFPPPKLEAAAPRNVHLYISRECSRTKVGADP